MTDDQPIAWTAIAPNTPVASADGQLIGKIVDVLGSREEDVFHGIVVEIGGHRHAVSSGDVASLGTARIETTLTADELRALPDDEGSASFHAGVRGIFGTHHREHEEFDPDERAR